MRNSTNAGFNQAIHDSDTDAEAAARAEHAALAKMALPAQPIAPPAPVAPLVPTASPIAPPPHAMEHPAFHGIINALRKPKASQTLRIAPGLKSK